MKKENRFLLGFALSLLLVAALVASRSARAFTQSGVGIDFIGNGIPMGHEWITRLAALEVLGADPIVPPDPNDPRKQWPPQGHAKNPSVSGAQSEVERIKSHRINDDVRYASVYQFVFAAIIGQRWVDIGGFNVSKANVGGYNCFDDVAQEPVDVQYDHFMRRFDERDGVGGVSAAAGSQQRFINYFVAAATATSQTMKVWDGGGFSAQVEVDRNYFLFGRAVHLFQDSFSSEHTVRISADWFNRVRQVKSYLCAAGAEQHSHSRSKILDFTSGDVIWIPGTKFNSGWGSYKPSFMKPTALAATEASKDLWAAFIRTMAMPMPQREQAARNEAATLVKNWLSYDDAEVRGWYGNPAHRDATYVLGNGDGPPGQTVPACMEGLKVGTLDPAVRNGQIESVRRVCIYNIVPIAGYGDLGDPSLRIPFNWDWKGATWQMPPNGWQIPNVPADTGTPVRIRSVASGQFMTAPGGMHSDSIIHCKPGAPIDFIRVGDGSNVFFRARYAPSLFLSYNLTPGDAKLWAGTAESNYRLDPQSQGVGIFNPRWGNYFWLNGEIPRLNRSGDPKNANARWYLDQQK